MLSPRQRVALLSAGLVLAVPGASVVTSATASAAPTRYEAESTPSTCDGVIETGRRISTLLHDAQPSIYVR